MTIKCVNEATKDTIVQMYSVRKIAQKEIAFYTYTSARTVNRVLNERGVLTAVPQLKAEAYQAMQLLKKYSLSVKDLDVLLSNIEHTKQSPASFVESYLLAASEGELGCLFWMATKAKIKQELAQEAKQTVHQQEDESWETHIEALDEPLPF